jgi:mannose-6-phosphate isomerase-like protein (cupin superfamily)
MIYCIDIDETLCHSIEDDYAHSVPCPMAIAKVNKLYGEGHTIKLFTGRGSFDNTDWRPFVEKQLKKWAVKYHELVMGKPHADVFIDDKAINTMDWMENGDTIKEVIRDWGKELWIVNCEEYCSKLLYLPKGAWAGYHYHKKKKETFYCLRGQVLLNINNKEIIIDPFSKPITIMPEECHSFKGCSNAVLLEISTHHSEDDVVFLSYGHKEVVNG